MRGSRIEFACRWAGTLPTHSKNGARARNIIVSLLRQGVASDADLKFIADWLRGKFDRKGKGRPANGLFQYYREILVDDVLTVQREQQCSRDEAIRRVLDQIGDTDPRAFRRLRNDVNRSTTRSRARFAL